MPALGDARRGTADARRRGDAIKVALIAPYPDAGEPPRGGIEVSVVQLARQLAAGGMDVAVIAPGKGAPYRDDQVEVLRCPTDSRLTLIRGFREWRHGVDEILQKLDPDIAHGHGLPAAGLAAVHGGHRARRVITVHGNVSRDMPSASWRADARARRGLREAYSRAAVRRADAVIGVHPDWRVNVPVAVTRFVHIPNVVDASFLGGTPRPEGGRVLYCGGPRRVKGWDVLRAAWASVAAAVPAAKLEIVGWTGEIPADLRADPSMTFTGWLRPEQTTRAMARARVVVIPSRYEVAPLVLGEAWAMGVGVVATAAGGLASLAGGAAVVVPPAHRTALADALVSALTGRIDLSPLISEGRRRVASWTADECVRRHLAVYERLLDRAPDRERSPEAPSEVFAGR